MFDVSHHDTMYDPMIKAHNGPLPDTDANNDASTAPPGRGVNGPLPDMDANLNGPLPDKDEPKTIHVHSGLDEDLGTLPVTDAINTTTTIEALEGLPDKSTWNRHRFTSPDISEDTNEIRGSMTGLDANYAKLIRAEYFPTTEYDTPFGQIVDCSCNDIEEHTRKRRAAVFTAPVEPKKICHRCPEFSFFSLGASPPGRNYIGAVPVSQASFSKASFGIEYRERTFFSEFDFLDEMTDSVDCALYEDEYKNPLDAHLVNDLASCFASLNISKQSLPPSSECTPQPILKDSDTSPIVSMSPKEPSANKQKLTNDCFSPVYIDDASSMVDQSTPHRRESFRFSDDFHPIDFDEDFAVPSETRQAPFECSFSTIASIPNDGDASQNADFNSILGISSIHDTSANPISFSSPDSQKSQTVPASPPSAPVSASIVPAFPSSACTGSDANADSRSSVENISIGVPSSSSDSSSSLRKTAREPTPLPVPNLPPMPVSPIRAAPIAVPNPPRRALNRAAAARIQIQRNNLEARFCEGFMSISLMLKDIASDHFDRTRTEAWDLVNKLQRIRTSLRRLYNENDTASKTVDEIRRSYDRVKTQLTKAEVVMDRLDPIN